MLYLNHFSLVTALGTGTTANRQGLHNEQSGLQPCTFSGCDLDTWTGSVSTVNEAVLPNHLQAFDCRNNRLLELTIQQDNFAAAAAEAIARYGSDRVGVFIGTSTSGIQQTEMAYANIDDELNQLPEWFEYRHTHNNFSGPLFVRERLGARGPSASISTACSSSAKVFASASRAIRAGLCDAAIVGGADSLCLTTLYGFNSLQLVSASPCKPADINRDGLSIGEAAGLAVISADQPAEIAVLGYGESGDAHHMSSPEPDGAGAYLAMQRALQQANITAEEVGYINLHGTATPANDRAEDRAICKLFGKQTACSSTKGWTGHTLGAAGIVETIFTAMSLQDNWLPRSLNTEELDPEIHGRILLHSKTQNIDYALSNSFGFGGNNCSLLLGRGR